MPVSVLIIFTVIYHLVIAESNNVCITYSSYLNIRTSSNCYYSPDVYDTVPNIINRHTGNRGETHKVQADDGHILTLFRLRRENPKGVILFNHCYLLDSSIWMTQDNESTALLFWNKGYDVWLNNYRGTRYSAEHVNLTLAEPEFWNFSIHEIGYFDHQNVIDYVVSQTKSRIFYVGHSLGGATGQLYASLRPEHASKNVIAMILLAPGTYISRKYSSSAIFSNFLHTLTKPLRGMLGPGLCRYDSWYVKTIRNLGIRLRTKYIISVFLSWISGWTPEEFDPKLLNLMLSSVSGTSWKVLDHFMQTKNSEDGKSHFYDYGTDGNLKLYGTKTAPAYPLKNIVTPQYVFTSKEDNVCPFHDVTNMYNDLPANVRLGIRTVPRTNHLDYHWGKHRIEQVYKPILGIIDKLL